MRSGRIGTSRTVFEPKSVALPSSPDTSRSGKKKADVRIRDVAHRLPLKLRQQEQPGVLAGTDDVEVLDLERNANHPCASRSRAPMPHRIDRHSLRHRAARGLLRVSRGSLEDRAAADAPDDPPPVSFCGSTRMEVCSSQNPGWKGHRRGTSRRAATFGSSRDASGHRRCDQGATGDRRPERPAPAAGTELRALPVLPTARSRSVAETTPRSTRARWCVRQIARATADS